MRYGGPPGATIFVPEPGYGAHVPNLVSQGFNVISCEPDDHKYRYQIDTTETEVVKIIERAQTPIVLPRALMWPHKDNRDDALEETLRFWPAPSLFASFGAGDELVRKFIHHVDCLRVISYDF